MTLVYETNRRDKVNVLGVSASETEGRLVPIVADIDAHNFATKKQHLFRIYDTSKQEEHIPLKEEISKLLANKEGFNVEEYKSAIHTNMGKITAQELIAFYTINKICGRLASLHAFFQHGVTANMDEKEVNAARAKGAKVFPGIERKTIITAINHQTRDKALIIEGQYILPFYEKLNNDYRYNFKFQNLWLTQLKEIKEYKDINEIYGYFCPSPLKGKSRSSSSILSNLLKSICLIGT